MNSCTKEILMHLLLEDIFLFIILQILHIFLQIKNDHDFESIDFECNLFSYKHLESFDKAVSCVLHFISIVHKEPSACEFIRDEYSQRKVIDNNEIETDERALYKRILSLTIWTVHNIFIRLADEQAEWASEWRHS